MSAQQICLFSLICLIIYINIDLWIFIFWVIIQYYLSLCSIVPTLVFESSYSYWVRAFTYFHYHVCLFEALSYTRTVRCYRPILCISCPSPRTIHFFKEPWFLFLENCIWNQVVGTKNAWNGSVLHFLQISLMSNRRQVDSHTCF